MDDDKYLEQFTNEHLSLDDLKSIIIQCQEHIQGNDPNKWWFSQEEIDNAEQWCKEFNPHICPDCKRQTMLDRGKKFQCGLCGLEYECMDLNNMKNFRHKVRKEIMKKSSL